MEKSERCKRACRISNKRQAFFGVQFVNVESCVIRTPQPTKTPGSPQNTTPAPAIVKRTNFKNYQRKSFYGYSGRGYVIKNFEKLVFTGRSLFKVLAMHGVLIDISGVKGQTPADLAKTEEAKAKAEFANAFL